MRDVGRNRVKREDSLGRRIGRLAVGHTSFSKADLCNGLRSVQVCGC